jgi:Ni/Co efflux regulator RcnB
MTMIKRVAAAAFALSLLGGASALAQQGPSPGDGQHGHDGGQNNYGGGDGGVSHGAGGASGVPGGGAPNIQGGGSHGGGGGGYGGYPGGGQHGGPGGYAAPQGGGVPHGGPGGYMGGDGRDHQGDWRDRGERDRDWRGGDRHDWHGERPRYEPRFFPHTLYREHRRHWRGEWRAPPGFYYRQWRYGDRLPWGWFDQSFWIMDFYDYDLPAPPYGYEWIRVGPDAVLVDLNSGMVVETMYGAFY